MTPKLRRSLLAFQMVKENVQTFSTCNTNLDTLKDPKMEARKMTPMTTLGKLEGIGGASIFWSL